MISEEYKNLSAAEHKKLEKLVENDKKRYEREYSKWEEKFGDEVKKIKKM